MRSSSFLLLLFVVLSAGTSYAQGDVRDTSILMVPVTVSYSYQVPNGEMSERFGPNSNIGLSAAVKFKSNYLIGLDGSFIFGNKVNEPGLLQNMVTSDGSVLDVDGQLATVLLLERGYNIFLWGGKIIPIVGPNPNSGLLLKVGGGMMRHKIRIETQENVVPQLEGDYLHGYDRLTGGPAAMLFMGYQHIGSNRLTNFMIGFEVTMGFTEPLRAYNFDTGSRDAGTRSDGLNGLRFGWTLPIYKRAATDYYIN